LGILAADINTNFLHYLDNDRIDTVGGFGAGRISNSPLFCQYVKESLCHLASTGIMDADEKNLFHNLSMEAVG